MTIENDRFWKVIVYFHLYINFPKLSKILLAFFDFLVVRYLDTGTPKRLALKMDSRCQIHLGFQFRFINSENLGHPTVQADVPGSATPEGIGEYPSVPSISFFVLLAWNMPTSWNKIFAKIRPISITHSVTITNQIPNIMSKKHLIVVIIIQTRIRELWRWQAP